MEGSALLTTEGDQKGIVQGDIDAEAMNRKIGCGLQQLDNCRLVPDLGIRDQNEILRSVGRVSRRHLQNMCERRTQFGAALGAQSSDLRKLVIPEEVRHWQRLYGKV